MGSGPVLVNQQDLMEDIPKSVICGAQTPFCREKLNICINLKYHFINGEPFHMFKSVDSGVFKSVDSGVFKYVDSGVS